MDPPSVISKIIGPLPMPMTWAHDVAHGYVEALALTPGFSSEEPAAPFLSYHNTGAQGPGP